MECVGRLQKAGLRQETWSRVRAKVKTQYSSRGMNKNAVRGRPESYTESRQEQDHGGQSQMRSKG